MPSTSTGTDLAPDVIAMSHDIDDLSTDLARCRHAMANATILLAAAAEALRLGHRNVTDEYIDRALTALRAS